ncbi:MAG: hypothetical protein HKN41_10945 [Ilumatobacter sp.]|nr:hypothetical protein [Ilumatobacter sp.]
MPIDVRPAGPNWRLIVAGVAVLGAMAGIAYVVTSGDGEGGAADGLATGEPAAGSETNDDGAALATAATLAATSAGVTTASGPVYSPLAEPVRLSDDVTVEAGAPAPVVVAGVAGALETNLVALRVEVDAPQQAGSMTVVPCAMTDARPNVSFAVDDAVVQTVVVPIAESGEVCVTSTADATVTVDAIGFLDQQAARPFAKPVTILDTTADGVTDDDRFATIGVRPEGSTLKVPVVSRFAGLDDVGALMVAVEAVDPLASGELSVFAAEAAVPDAALIEYEPDADARGADVVPIGPSGALCVATTGSTDVVVTIVALVPASVVAPIGAASDADAAEPTCAGEEFFPGRRVVALYGTQRSERLGVLGEQPPEEAAERLDEIAEPWRAGDRPVLPAFELIATLATGTPEDRGVYNIRSEPEFVQEYLDVARRHGYYLILDLQPGQSDFLTEAIYYEEFLRQPDVGLALDPEWRTEAPDRPKGGFVGQVDAAEVNQVSQYLARLVDEEDLPEKLLIVHQFQDRMITNKDQLIEPPGVALTIHMDGFGPRPEKLNSYRVVKVPPPLNMGLKLFYDEDTDLLSADDVLNGGLFDPVPDLVTYQ